jgi:glyoxylase-like metal-dependent hydrolase (beta-lactamase superfamily II)
MHVPSLERAMRQLREDLWYLELGYRAPLDANAYLLDESERDGRSEMVTLVDTGLRYARGALESELSAAGYEPGDVGRVLVTHYDLDHTGGLERHDFGCPVYMGSRDVDLMDGGHDPPLTHHKGAWHRLVRRWFRVPEHYDLRRVEHGDRIGGFTAFHTPGHNPGHVAYVHDSGAAFLGDLVWISDGAYSTPFWGDSYDMHQLRESIRTFASTAPDFEVACTGHGLPFVEGGRERLRRFAEAL